MLTAQQVDQLKHDACLHDGLLVTYKRDQTMRREIDRVIDDDRIPDVPQPVLLCNLNGSQEVIGLP